MISDFFLQQGIGLEIAEGPSVTVVTAWTPDGDFVASGEAKCGPDDRYDAQVGQTLATARALESLAEIMERYAIARGFNK